MQEPTALFFDIGGVVLTNGWDRAARMRAVAAFGLDGEELEERHELLLPAFEKGAIGLEGYLDRVVFHRERPFFREDFRRFMLDQSKPIPESIALLERLVRSGRYLLATLNNESLALNAYRVEHFGLRRYFTVFLCSAYLGARKPEEAAFRLALLITQRTPEESVFIDDRDPNIEAARESGFRVVHFRGAGELEKELAALGVTCLDPSGCGQSPR